MAAAGGVPAWIGGKLEGTRSQDRQVRRFDEQIADIDQFDKTADAFDKQVKEEMKEGKHTYGAGYRSEAAEIKYGTDRDAYAAKVAKTSIAYSEATAAVQKFSDPSYAGSFEFGGTTYADRDQARLAAENARDAAERTATSEAKAAWDAQYESTIASAPADSELDHLKKDYEKSAKKIGITQTKVTKRDELTEGKKQSLAVRQPLEREKREYTQRGQYKANHGKNN